jgi:YrhK-like protein
LGETDEADPRDWWRPDSRGWWMAILFAVGSLCFVVGALASNWASTSRPAIGVTFFVGSIFFTSAGYLQYSEAVNVEHGSAAGGHRRRWRPASWEPRRIDWLASLIQLIGTVLFNISTFAALNHNLTTHQSNTRVWAPDAFGSVAFLVSSGLAFAEVCHSWASLRKRSLSWWIAAINLLGSIAFGVSAVASLVEPDSGQPLSTRIANSGTALGGICFLVAALMLIPEAANARREARRSAPAAV